MSVHGTPVNNVLNPREPGLSSDPAALDRLFFAYTELGGGAEFSLSATVFRRFAISTLRPF